MSQPVSKFVAQAFSEVFEEPSKSLDSQSSSQDSPYFVQIWTEDDNWATETYNDGFAPGDFYLGAFGMNLQLMVNEYLQRAALPKSAYRDSRPNLFFPNQASAIDAWSVDRGISISDTSKEFHDNIANYGKSDSVDISYTTDNSEADSIVINSSLSGPPEKSNLWFYLLIVGGLLFIMVIVTIAFLYRPMKRRELAQQESSTNQKQMSNIVGKNV